MEKRPPTFFLLPALGLAAIIGYLDFVTGFEVSVGLFYLLPVSLAAWYLGRGAAVCAAIGCSIVWYVADIGHDYSHTSFRAWNAFIRFGFFLTCGLLLSALRRSLVEQQQLARTDSLTGLFTRRAFEECFEHDLALTQRLGQPISLAYIDLDDFKEINDTRGHAEGDTVLKTVADTLRRKLRRADSVARLGGDEFAVLMPNTNPAGARHVADGLSAELRLALAGVGHQCTCSIGVVTFLDPSIPVSSAIAAADEVMYDIKRKGKGAIGYAVRPDALQDQGAEPAAPCR